MRANNATVVSGGASGGNFTSSSFWMWETFRLSAQVVVSSGSLNGSFALQFSNDKPVGAPPNAFQPTNWVTLGSTSILANASSSATVKTFMFPQFEVGYAYGRLIFTDASAGASVGTFNANVVTFAL